MAEEDLIFGKNRHFFGGIEPSNMIEFKASYDTTGSQSRAKIVARLPIDTVIGGQTLCSIAGAVIRRKVGAYPADEFDGTLIRTIAADETFVDEDVVIGTTYYYAAFPYTTQGVYNRNAANRSVCTITAGYEPENMKSFTVTSAYNDGQPRVRVNAVLPDNGPESRPYTIAGAVIRRSTTGYPTSEMDGDLVKNVTVSEAFYDTNVVLNRLYYYAAFPYTTQGVYNRNAANRASCTTVAVTPGNMQVFTAASVFVDNRAQVKLTATLPASTTGCTIAGAVIRRSTTGYPTSENSGEQVTTITTSGVYYDSNVEVGTTYYYTAFPYSVDGAYNVNGAEANRATCRVTGNQYLFGYDLVISTSNPSSRVTYPSDVDNVSFTPAHMNFTTGIFDYGGWNIAPGNMFMPRPCMLTYAGVVDHYLDPNDYTKRIDGTPSSIADSNFEGNAMMEWPKIWTKRWESNGVYHFRCSDAQIDDTYDCWCNYDKNDRQIEHFYTPIYCGYVTSNKLRSLSGHSNAMKRSLTSAFTVAAANGEDWCIEVLADRLLLQDLLVLMAKSTDGQTAYGRGYTTGTSGTMNDKGLFWGSNSSSDGVKVFGMEHMWGSIGRGIAGWFYKHGTSLGGGDQYVKLTRGTHDGSTATDYGTGYSGYKMVNNSAISNASGTGDVPAVLSGYIQKTICCSYGRIPYRIIGSSSTYEADLMMYDATYVSDMFAKVGGGTDDDVFSRGPFSVVFDNSASSNPIYQVCFSLSCKPAAGV